MKDDYVIGQVIYVVIRGENKVRPMQVVEEILRKTVDGVHRTYMLSSGGNDEPISIHELDAEFFNGPDAVRESLIQKASSTISKIVENARDKAVTLFGDQQIHEVEHNVHSVRAS